MLGALSTNFVVAHTASESQKETSGGADGRETMRGGVLERLKGGVGLQRLGDVLGALMTDAVVLETASESRMGTSGGADSRKMARGSVLELGEGLIDGEGLRNVPCALCTDAVVEQTAIESQTQTSGGTDSRAKGVRQRT